MQETLAILFTFCLIAGLFILVLYSRQRRQREVLEAQRDLQTRILERFDSPREFSDFLQTRGGQRFISGLTDERGWRPARRIMLAVQVGLVVTFFGLGLVILSVLAEARNALFPAVVVFSVGAGFLAAAAASYYMSKKWRLLPGQDELALEETAEALRPSYAASPEPAHQAPPTPADEPADDEA